MEGQVYNNVDKLNDRSQLNEVEIRYKYRLPDSFREFLMKYNGSYPLHNIVIVPGGVGPVILDHFISFNKNSNKSIYKYGNALGNGFFPIAINPDGLIFCLEKLSGRVYLTDPNVMESHYVTDSFDKLLSKLINEDYLNRLS